MLYDRKLDLDVIGRQMHQAADLMEQGWCQGVRYCHLAPNKHLYCATGAIGAVLGLNEDDYFYELIKHQDIFKEVKKRIFQYLNITENCQLWAWNDMKGQTKEKVVETFREAAYLK